MTKKKLLRDYFKKKRQKNYFEIKKSFFKPLKNFIPNSKKNFFLALYFPIRFEVNVKKVISTIQKKNVKFLLPVIKKSRDMGFYEWRIKVTLNLNKFGTPEPAEFGKPLIPNLMLIPLLAFDKQKFRLGYGGGYYDTFLKNNEKRNRSITTIGIAFSFQKYNKLPLSKHDKKLDYILTENGLIK